MASCPSDYALSFSWDGALCCETLYVVGGLYGNVQALQAIKKFVEPDARVVFNGDMHWFDNDAEQFRAIEEGAKAFYLLNGNVEKELSREIKSGAGCGCFYPDSVAQTTKSWANEIHAHLSKMVDAHLPQYKAMFQKRASCLGVYVGEQKIAITHGDEFSLAGWGCSRENLQNPQRQKALNAWFQENHVTVLASSHTCEAALLELENGVLINNGAAGLPNFKAPNSGVITRISTKPSKRALYGVKKEGLYIEAIDVAYDAASFWDAFRRLWDETSPAYRSYASRILNGVDKLPEATTIVAYDDRKTSFEARVPESFKKSAPLQTLQINVGRVCNLACTHCHVEASPKRTESMSLEVMQMVLEAFVKQGFQTIDITGGAPEMNPHFEWLLEQASKMASNIIVRTNLVILQEPNYRHLAEVYAKYKINLVASLPELCDESVDAVRGEGVYHDSIVVIKRLNALGYGVDPRLTLDFVYNPQGAVLPEAQANLERRFKETLFQKEGIVFNRLLAITNVPIGRFSRYLQQTGSLEAYETLLKTHFNYAALPNMMCRTQISVGYDGSVYDCDFNQMLGIKAQGIHHIKELTMHRASKRNICFGEHCYACTANAGSSCQGEMLN